MNAGIIELNGSMLMILINVVILYILLKRFFWEKVRKFMLDRQAAVQDAFDSAEAMNRRADEKMQNYSKRIANVEEEGREIIRQAKARADVQAKDIVDNAHKEAGDIIAKAERTIQVEREKATAEMRDEIASLALLAAEQIVEKEIQAEGQEAIIDEVLDKARSTGWQS